MYRNMCVYVRMPLYVSMCMCMRVCARTYVRGMLANILTALRRRSSAAMSRSDLLLNSRCTFTRDWTSFVDLEFCVLGGNWLKSLARSLRRRRRRQRENNLPIFHVEGHCFCKAMPNERMDNLAIKTSAALAMIKASNVSLSSPLPRLWQRT
jgi:hypothetical protein